MLGYYILYDKTIHNTSWNRFKAFASIYLSKNQHTRFTTILLKIMKTVHLEVGLVHCYVGHHGSHAVATKRVSKS